MENKFMEVAEDMVNSLHIASEDVYISLSDEVLFSSKRDALEYAKCISFMSEKYGDDFFDKAHIFALKFGEEDSKDYEHIVSKCIDRACDILMQRYGKVNAI